VTGPGGRPGQVRPAAARSVRPVLAVALVGLAAAAGVAAPVPGDAGAATTTTTTSNPWVPGVNGTLTVGIDRSPTGCNPNSAAGNTWADRLVLGPVLPSTFFVNANDQAVYDPATITQAELQSTTPETVVYTINPKAVWSDGKPVTAEDFIYTWEEERGTTGPVGPPVSATTPKTTAAATTTSLATTPSTSSTAAGTPSSGTDVPGATGTTGPSLGYRQISSIKASNHGLTFTVVFRRPYADWQSLFNELLPAHVLKKTGWSPSCTTLDPAVDLSAGPFVISKVVPGHEIDMVRNRRWWEQEPNLSRLVVMIASGPRQLAQWLRNGTIQVALPAGYDQAYLQTVSSQPSILSQSQPSTTFLELQFSTTSPLTSVTDLRLAVAHAVDRQAVVDKVAGWADSTIVPAASFLAAQTQNGYPAHKPPPLQVSGQPGYTSTTSGKSPTATPFPPTAALGTTDRILTNLGYVKPVGGTWQDVAGKPVTLRVAVDDGDPWAQQAAPELEHQLSVAGFVVDVVSAPDAQSAGTDLSTGAADLALLPMHSSPFPSQAIGWYTTLLGPAGSNGSQDWSGFNDPTLDGLLEKASEELNPIDAAPIYTQVNALLWQDMVALPLFTQPTLLAWSGTTAGVAPDPNVPSLLWSVQTWSTRVPPTSPDTQP
jgi:peptide/nickel transport system substrate-binding protein